MHIYLLWKPCASRFLWLYVHSSLLGPSPVSAQLLVKHSLWGCIVFLPDMSCLFPFPTITVSGLTLLPCILEGQASISTAIQPYPNRNFMWFSSAFRGKSRDSKISQIRLRLIYSTSCSIRSLPATLNIRSQQPASLMNGRCGDRIPLGAHFPRPSTPDMRPTKPPIQLILGHSRE